MAFYLQPPAKRQAMLCGESNSIACLAMYVYHLLKNNAQLII